MRCAKFLYRQAEAAAPEMMGKMADRVEVGLEAWAKKLEQDAKQVHGSQKAAATLPPSPNPLDAARVVPAEG